MIDIEDIRCAAQDSWIVQCTLEGVYQEVDGFFVFVQKPNSGYLDSLALRLIADILDDLNLEYEWSIEEYTARSS